MKHLGVAALAAIAFSTPALAGLDGTSMSATYYFPDSGSVYPNGNATPSVFVVGAGAESHVNVEDVTFLTVDGSDRGLTLQFNTRLSNPTCTNTDFNGLVFTGSGFETLSAFTILNGSTFGASNPDELDFSLVGNELRLNWGGVTYQDGDVLYLGFSNAGPGGVPEPATWAMFIMGFGLVGAAVRRRTAATV